MTYKQRCEKMEIALREIIRWNTPSPMANSLDPHVFRMLQIKEMAEKALEN